MKVKVAIVLLTVAFLELTNAANRDRYRVSRSYRKKKESSYNDDYNFDYDTAQQHPHQIETAVEHGGGEFDGEDEYHHIEVGKSGYSEGAGLRSIAQGSADQANSAVANQELAAKQASYIAQNNLANLALQASATAMAALQGKQVLLAKIEQENLDAHQSLENELQQLKQAKRSAKAAQQAAQQSSSHLAVLQAALNNAQTSSEHAQQAATEASAELASQSNMVGKAKARVQQLEDALHHARIDYEATVNAANDAAASAQIAQNNAAEAAAKASISSLHDIHSSLQSSHESQLQAHGSSQHPTIQAHGSSQHPTIQAHGSSQHQTIQAHGSSKHSSIQAHESSQHPSLAAAPSSNKDLSRNSTPKATIKSHSNEKQQEKIASNHNYSNSEFRPSKQFSFAGY